MKRAVHLQQAKRRLVSNPRNQPKKPAARQPAAAPGHAQGKPPSPPPLKSQLSADRRWLVELMQEVGFGSVNGLTVRRAQPQASPKPKVVYSRRLAGPDEERPERKLNDFVLKEPVVKLFRMFDRVRDGVILELVVRDGLPHEVKFEGPG